MKLKVFGLILAVFLFGAFLSGCGCFQEAAKGETPPPPPPPPKAAPPEAKKEVPVPPPPPPPAPAPVVMLKDINFDFDKYNIRPMDAEILKGNLEWFKANKGKRVKIEGNCDERGTVEYNLVLGQKRADSTKNYLANLGVDAKAMDTISYGKERPVCNEKNEACWAKNRRAHFAPLP